MTPLEMGLVGGDFRVGYRLQKTWDTTIAVAFFCGEVGAGLFFISLFTGLRTGLLLGLALVAIGKAGGHLVHLGRPSASWRALRKIRQSWISRGMASIMVMCSFGAVVTFDAFVPGVVPAALVGAAVIIAGAAALVITMYQGLAMSHSSSIGLWSTGLMPVISFAYALLGGMSVELALGWTVLSPAMIDMLHVLALGLVLMGFVIVISLIHAAKYGPEGGRKSVQLLLSGGNRLVFLALVIVVGFLATGALLTLGLGSRLLIFIAAMTELSGYFTFRVLMFKAGAYDPVFTLARPGRR